MSTEDITTKQTNKQTMRTQTLFDHTQTEDTLTVTLSDELAQQMANRQQVGKSVRLTTVERTPNRNMVRLPRRDDDRRFRSWSVEEKTFVFKMYAKGKTRHAIAKMLGVSHAPVTRLLFQNNKLNERHRQAAIKAGHY